MWSDPIESTLLQMREALVAIQRGHDVSFGALNELLNNALRVRLKEQQTGQVTRP